MIKNPKGDRQVSSNYRQIMVSSSLLKIAETHKLSHLEENISLNKLQFGFSKNSSTTDACFLLKEVVGANMGEKGTVYASFIDLSKAFDMVDHAILIKKLIDSELAIDIVLLIASYIRNQTARIVWDGQRGDFEHINAGVRQGGIMSPFLFNFYMDELLKTVSSLDCGCKLGVSRVNIVAYADDVAILANSAEQLNEIYRLFKVGIDMLGLKINEEKSKCLIFHKSKRLNISHNVLNSIKFEIVDNFEYLGFILKHNLDDSMDIEEKLKSFYSSFYSTFRNFNMVNIETFLFLFSSYCTPNYGLPLWSGKNVFKGHSLKTFNIAYSNALKKIIGVPKYSSSHIVANLCQVLLFKHRVALIQARYFKKVLKKSNHIFKINSIFLLNGTLGKHICNHFRNVYNVNIMDYEMDVLGARVEWVQKH